MLQTVLESTQYRSLWAESLAELEVFYATHHPALIFLQVNTFEELERCYQALSPMAESTPPPQVVLLCELDECVDSKELEQFSPLPIRLPLPVSKIYLSSRIQSWISQSESKGWRRAQFPEEERLRSQLAHQVIEEFRSDRGEEQEGEKARINGLIELAKQLMVLPSEQELTIALNVITLERQETLASSSISAERYCSRDLSICSHVIEEGSQIYAPDIFQNDKLKSYSSFVQTKGNEIIRGYLGFPLRLSGHIIGTLCCFSAHYLQFSKGQQDGLEQIAKLLTLALDELLHRVKCTAAP